MDSSAVELHSSRASAAAAASASAILLYGGL